LAGRVFTELKNVTETLATKLSRRLTDGLVQGQNPRTIAKGMVVDLGMASRQAETIARTEIIRAHAEGAIDHYEELGVTELGVMVEWSTAGDGRVCPLCRALEGIVITTKEAHGMFPRHPNCRCTPVPANVGEDTTGQKRGKAKVKAAIDQSIRLGLPKSKKTLPLAQARERSNWAGADKTISKHRPTPTVTEEDLK
jgi:SPP1 gp7 family putative phage head morphogenesis protein